MIEKFFSTPYIVIGMHRSGTSLMSELLYTSGVFMGNDLTADKESWYFQRINTELLSHNGFSEIHPGVPTYVNGTAPKDLELVRHYVSVGKHPGQLVKLMGGGAWGWKDPRNTFTLQYWLKLFPKAKVINIYRNGLDVAISLYNRNCKLGKENKWYEPSLEKESAGLDLWEKYLEQSFSYQSLLGDRMVSVQFEKLIVCDENEISKLEAFTGIPFKSTVLKIADRERTGRFKTGHHEDLLNYARQSKWMKKLGYINEIAV